MKNYLDPISRAWGTIRKWNGMILAGGCIVFLFLFSACEINRLRSAEDLYNRGRHAGAIQDLDELILVAKNGAVKTRAELIRSNSYLELGKLAAERQNNSLAIRFLKLSNSEAADIELANIYKKLGEQAFRNGDKVLAMQYMNDIIREIPNSSLIPETILRRISILMDEYKDYNSTWEAYKDLYDRFPNNSYELQARNYVLKFIDARINYARILLNQQYYTDSLKELFELSRYPVVNATQINALISDVYQAKAEEYIDAQDYIEADRLYRISIQYNPDKKGEIDRRLEEITSLFVRKGNSLLEDRDFDGALLHYNKTFEIIPDYKPALDAIARMNRIKSNIKQAEQLYQEGEKLEANQKFADALKLYNQAISLDSQAEYKNRASIMQNLIEAAKNPTGFAQRVLSEYRGGIIPNRVAAKRAELLTTHKASELRDSGWKILLSTGQYKYEARYDLLTPTETFLYVWQINLRDRTVIPLNKLSEALMK